MAREKKKKEQNIKLTGSLALYMAWPWVLAVCMVLVDVFILLKNRQFGIWCSIGVVAYLTITLILFLRSRNTITIAMREYAKQFGFTQKKLLTDHATPYALLNADGSIAWMNRAFHEIAGGKAKVGSDLTEMFPNVTVDYYPELNDQSVELSDMFRDRDYKLEIRKVENNGKKSDLTRDFMKGDFFYTICLHDETAMNDAIRKKEEESLIVGLVYIDNYDEILDKVEEVRQALLIALIDRKIAQYFATVEGVVRKLDKEKYFVIIKQKFYEDLKTDKFAILKDVKTNIGNSGVIPTLSIGLGLGAESYPKNYQNARMAIDLALGRGGDQCVIKAQDQILYFGGKSEARLTSTKVKARVKAEALREFITSCTQIIVMGHKIADVDCFGAAMGIFRMAREMGKRCYVVLDEDDLTVSVRPFLNDVRKNVEGARDLFVTSDEIIKFAIEGTLLVVVDTNRPSYTQCPALLEKAGNIVVIDHHRQMSEAISNAALSYLEPYASSASEMVTEIMQYISEDVNPNKVEANCLYAGIIVDTHNFNQKTGERTFEAAAYLRRCGADITKIRKILRDDIDSYRAKADCVRSAEIYKNYFAIARFPQADIPSPTVIGSQAADELLDINEVKASFVFTEYKNAIYVSARSIDEVNVQVIMEKLGGGGHMSMAGAQFKDTTMEEAVSRLKDTINQMIKGGELE